MIHEFEGKTEKEAIDNAIAQLGLSRDEIDIEIVENKKGKFIFGGGKVKIKVHISEEKWEEMEPEGETDEKLLNFLNTLILKMNLEGKASIIGREDGKIILNIESDESSILIGRKGKNLDALQLLINIYANRITKNGIKVILDSESYRERKEKNIVELARRTAEQVRRSRRSVLLQPMNPFERRIIHTTLSDHRNIETISEGEGLYKKVRVFYKENSEH